MPERKPGFLSSIGMSEIISRLPTEQALVESDISPPDIFICALGFESRALALPQSLSGHWELAPIKAVSLIGEYQTNKSDNELNREPLQQALNKFSNSIVSTDADCPNNIHRTITAIIDTIEKVPEQRINIVFDISGASANFIISVMYALFKRAQRIQLTVIYAEAEEYFPRKILWDSDEDGCIAQACDFGNQDTFLDYGVENPERNELYPGLFHDARPDFVIAIPGYRTQRLVRCISAVGDQILANPRQSIYWIFGVPPRSERTWRLELQRKMLLRIFNEFSGSKISECSELFDCSNSKNCSTLNYKEVLTSIIEIADKQLGKRITIVPMGSKLQSIGLSLALAVREEIGITIARPSKFNPQNYSKATGPCYSLSLGPLNEVLHNLRRVGELKFQTTGGRSGLDRPSI